MSQPPDAAEEKLKGAMLVAASLIAAIRLRGERIENSPKVVYTIGESVQLARMVLRRIEAS